MKDRWRIVFYEGSMKDLGSMILHKKIDLHRSFMHPSWKDRWRIKKSILHQSFMDPFRKDRGRIAEGSFLWRIVFWWRIDEGSFFMKDRFLMEDRWRIFFLWRIDFLWKIDEGSFFMKDRWRIVFYEGSMKDLGSMILHKKIDLHRSFMHPSWKDRSFINLSWILLGRIEEGSLKDLFLWRIVFWWRIDEGSFFMKNRFFMKDRWRIVFYEGSMKDRFLWRIDEGSRIYDPS